MAELNDKQALQQWEIYKENIRKKTALQTGETEVQQRERITRLEADHEAWFKYYFPQYCYAEPAKFHKDSSERIISHAEWFEVRNWSRELAKDVRTMFEVLFLMLTGKKRYMLMISNSYDAAEKFLKPYRANLEVNQRIIYDYGVQELPGSWTSGEFTTRKGFGFKAVGAGQSPRGTRNEEVRPDVIVFNDIDTDEDCRNPDTISSKWKWCENAAIGTRSISKPTLILFLGNIIAEYCCVVLAGENADHVDVVNIRDEDGNSSWPEKNTEEMIERVLSKVSYASYQGEYFNNPISEGKVFSEITFGDCPPMKELQFIEVYADPSPSNRDKPSIKSRMQNSCKSVCIVGYYQNIYYVYKVWVEHTTNANFIDWLYAARKLINQQCPAYFHIENNTLQDPFYEQVLKPLIYKRGLEPGNVILAITADDRKKPDKFFRIEGTLEPLNRNGFLVFNAKEKETPHMKRAQAQFKGVSANSKLMDAPDAIEGAVKIIESIILDAQPGAMRFQKRQRNPKVY
jgi:hypothetical protein